MAKKDSDGDMDMSPPGDVENDTDPMRMGRGAVKKANGSHKNVRPPETGPTRMPRSVAKSKR